MGRNRSLAARVPGQQVTRIALAFCLVSLAALAACGGDTTPVVAGDTSPQPSFQIKRYLDLRQQGGLSMTLTGSRQDPDGNTTDWRQEHSHAPVEAFGPWRGVPDAMRQSAVVDEYIGGTFQATTTYYGYYRPDGSWIGDQAGNSDVYVLRNAFRIAPMSAQIGDTGSGPAATEYSPNGEERTRYLNWEMKRNDAGEPVYCENYEELIAGNTQTWQYTWCYGMAEDGTPTNHATYQYSDDRGFSGSLETNNLRFPLTGDAPLPSDSRLPTYRVKQYFSNLVNGGASYSLRGTFTSSSGTVTEQRHDQIRRPLESFGNWRGVAGTQRQVVRVDRYVNGQPGNSSNYSRFYAADKNYLGTQEGLGNVGYRMAAAFSTRPVSAQVGDRGAGPNTIIFDADGRQVGTRTVSLWEMKEGADGKGLYCETIDETDIADAQVWQFTWCYGMEQNGEPTNHLRFSYDAGNGNVGLIEANDLVWPLNSNTEPPPPPACEVNCEPEDRDGF
ncbi:MAG: hypothetical protein WBD13_03600 [Burkholderiaceae bacterium]